MNCCTRHTNCLWINLKKCFTLPDYRTCHQDATCDNTIGSYICTCNDGYRGEAIGPEGCEDIDECLINNGGCQILHADCNNYPGMNNCTCHVGYQGDGVGVNGCEDVNECEMENGGCHGNATCHNTDGSRECQCLLGE